MQQVPATHQVENDLNRFSDVGEWFLLREDAQVGGSLFRAGTPVARVHNRWFLRGSDEPIAENLEGRVCRAEYGGLSLHVVSTGVDGVVTHWRIGSDEHPEPIPASRVISPPESGRNKIYLAFGDQFYPLEYFGW